MRNKTFVILVAASPALLVGKAAATPRSQDCERLKRKAVIDKAGLEEITAWKLIVILDEEEIRENPIWYELLASPVLGSACTLVSRTGRYI